MNKLAQENYDLAPDFIKENLYYAMEWANKTLSDREGIDWNINVTGNDDRKVCCCFDKSRWNADHCGKYMETASEAVVVAVCEYLDREVLFDGKMEIFR